MPAKTRKAKLSRRKKPLHKSSGVLSRIFKEGYERWAAIDVYLRRNCYVRYSQRCRDRRRLTPIWKYATPRQFTLMSQIGGGHITVNAQTFEYNEVINDEGNLIALYGDTDEGRSHVCFRIDFDIHLNGQKYAVLSSLDGRESCSTDGSALSANILLAAVELARENGAQWIELSDASKICKDEYTASISLADYYFLSRAKTWYETILPLKPDEPEVIDDIREQVTTKSWNDVVTALRRRHPVPYRNMLRDIPISFDSIPVDEPGSIMQVIRSIPREKRCLFLHKYMNNIFDALSIRSLDGMNWWMPLTPEADRPPPYVTELRYDSIDRNGHDE